MQGAQVQSLGQEDYLEKEVATLSSILAWKIPQTEEPGMLQSMGSQRVKHDWSDLANTHACKNVTGIGEIPLQEVQDKVLSIMEPDSI